MPLRLIRFVIFQSPAAYYIIAAGFGTLGGCGLGQKGHSLFNPLFQFSASCTIISLDKNTLRSRYDATHVH